MTPDKPLPTRYVIVTLGTPGAPGQHPIQTRRIVPVGMERGPSPAVPGARWIVRAFDLDAGEVRLFGMGQIMDWREVGPLEVEAPRPPRLATYSDEELASLVQQAEPTATAGIIPFHRPALEAAAATVEEEHVLADASRLASSCKAPKAPMEAALEGG